MQYVMQNSNLSAYLQATEAIDHEDPAIRLVASKLFRDVLTGADVREEDLLPADPEVYYARAAYLFVRDRIAHSADTGATEVTRRASEVLLHRHGTCYAKSLLLAALLRAGGIPAGICYQYLQRNKDEDTLVIHALNAVYFDSIGKWIRLDARGNKPGVEASFSLAQEHLAFPVRPELGETDLPLIYPEHDRAITVALARYESAASLFANLPRKIIGTP